MRRVSPSVRRDGPASHRGGQCARLTGCDEGETEQHPTERRRRRPGYSTCRMRPDSHHGLRGAVVILLLVLTATAPARAQRRHKWWQSPEVKAELGLTDAKSAVLDEIFQSTRPKQRELMEELQREEGRLSDLIRAMEAEEEEVTRQIENVERVRSALSKTRILMLYRMHRELSVDQRTALHDWMGRNRSHQGHPSSCR